MKHTENYNLNKIELTDSPPDITALNPNFDKIDAELKRLTDKDTELGESINQVKNDYLPKMGGNITNGLTVKNKTVAVSVNGAVADANGNITIDVGGDVQSINGIKPDENGDVTLDFGDGNVQSVDGVEADEEGNVALNASTRDEILEGAKRVTDVEVDISHDPTLPVAQRNVGDEWVSYTGVIPVGGVPYCGQEVTREVYSDLWEYAQIKGLVKSESEWQSIASAQNGNVPYYSDGNGSTTFRMPSIKGYVKGASSQSESGSYVAEGLPNVWGEFDALRYNAGDSVGDVISNGSVNVTVDYKNMNNPTGSNVGTTRYDIDASRSNPIYGNSDHVTPETSIVMFGVYAFGEITNQGALDAETLATGLATIEVNKADKTQWVAKYVTLSSNTTLGTFTLDLSDYLPDDGTYEVLTKIYLDRSDDSGDNTNFYIVYGGEQYLHCVADGKNFQQQVQCGIVPFTISQGLKYSLTNYKPNKANIELYGYKKVN